LAELRRLNEAVVLRVFANLREIPGPTQLLNFIFIFLFTPFRINTPFSHQIVLI
jgi:hypothetical protein